MGTGLRSFLFLLFLTFLLFLLLLLPPFSPPPPSPPSPPRPLPPPPPPPLLRLLPLLLLSTDEDESAPLTLDLAMKLAHFCISFMYELHDFYWEVRATRHHASM